MPAICHRCQLLPLLLRPVVGLANLKGVGNMALLFQPRSASFLASILDVFDLFATLTW